MKTKREALRAEARERRAKERFIAFGQRGSRKWFIKAHEDKHFLLGYAQAYAGNYMGAVPVTVHVAEILETIEAPGLKRRKPSGSELNERHS